MTPKQKAIELIDEYSLLVPIEFGGMDKNLAKQCALIAVEEIIESEKLDYLFSKEEINSMEFTSDSMWVYERFTEYWQEVKEEIRNI